MDFQEPPAVVIHIPDEKHLIGEEVVEHVARLLTRQAGEDPDHDDRCTDQPSPLGFPQTTLCDLSVVPRPHWLAYRNRAIELLKVIFR